MVTFDLFPSPHYRGSIAGVTHDQPRSGRNGEFPSPHYRGSIAGCCGDVSICECFDCFHPLIIGAPLPAQNSPLEVRVNAIKFVSIPSLSGLHCRPGELPPGLHHFRPTFHPLIIGAPLPAHGGERAPTGRQKSFHPLIIGAPLPARSPGVGPFRFGSFHPLIIGAPLPATTLLTPLSSLMASFHPLIIGAPLPALEGLQ